jgi:voltage-gated potassium channel
MTRYERWSPRSERPLQALVLLFLLILAAPIVWPDLHGWPAVLVQVGDVAIWPAFAADYLIRLALVDRRRWFIRIPDLAAVALPALRPLRLLRLFSAGQMLAARGRRNIVAQASRVIAAAAVLLVGVSAVMVLDAERGKPGANINTIGDALWWAATTITTVGYGDRYPLTVQGRAVAVALMVLGIALLGILTASIAAWFLKAINEADAEALEPVEDRIPMLEAKADEILRLLRRETREARDDGPGPSHAAVHRGN